MSVVSRVAVAALALTITGATATTGVLASHAQTAPPPPAPATSPAPGPVPYEVWTIDQTDSRAGYGGLLHIYAGRDLEADAATAQPRTVDLGGEASDLCLQKTGARPVRPHMLVFSGGRSGDQRYAVIAWVASGHVLILDADALRPVDCLRTSAGANGQRQAHAAWVTPDQQWLIVANQNGKLLERIRTDWERRTFILEPTATLNLHEGTTPSGAAKQDPALRPDNAPICVRTTADGRFTFVSLRGGGAFVVDHTAEPMRIVAEYDQTQIGDNGCGQVQAGNRMYLNAGAGQDPTRLDRPHASEVYVVDLDSLSLAGTRPNTPPVHLLYRRDGDVDAHALAVTSDERYLLAGDRMHNDVTVVDTTTDQVVNRFSLLGGASDDPAPDLFDLSPDGHVLFTSLRGPTPLSGAHAAIGSTPGVGVVHLRDGGTNGGPLAVAPARRHDGKSPDPHALHVRTLRS